MAENRYQELLGLPQDVSDPDYYALLGVERGAADGGRLDELFKSRMTRLQEVHSPKHKEFVEFLKGELKKARAVLEDPVRRDRYDAELKAEREAVLRKLVSHMLVDGTLSTMGEISLVAEGQRLGIALPDIGAVVDAELQRTGAQRVASKKGDAGTQLASNQSVREAARALEEARIAAKFAEARARHAETARERAEAEAAEALERAREAQALARETQSRESVRVKEADSFRHATEEKVRSLNQRLVSKEDELQSLQKRLMEQAARLSEAAEELQRAAARGRRSERMIIAVTVAMFAALGGQVLRLYIPEAARRFKELGVWSVQRGTLAAAACTGGVVLALLVLIAIVAGRPAKGPTLILTLALAAVALLIGGAFLQ